MAKVCAGRTSAERCRGSLDKTGCCQLICGQGQADVTATSTCVEVIFHGRKAAFVQRRLGALGS